MSGFLFSERGVVVEGDTTSKSIFVDYFFVDFISTKKLHGICVKKIFKKNVNQKDDNNRINFELWIYFFIMTHYYKYTK